MEKFSYKFAVALLAFSVGVAFASIYYFRSISNEIPEVHEVVENPLQPENPPPPQQSNKTLEMVFVLDTTGSMGGLLEGAKQRIWGIINEVMQKKSHPRVKVGLVAYRDRGDDYVTKLLPLTEDLDKVYTTLMDFEADGGGDQPENVRRALAEGVRAAGWSKQQSGVAQIVFLVGDAPPQKYENEPDVLDVADEAVRKNMIVNTIQCGNEVSTRSVWQQIANRGQGDYFAIAQNGGVETVRSPFDERLAELGGKIGETYLAYGENRAAKTMAQEVVENKVASMSANTSTTTKADRALNKAMNKEAYSDDLLQDIENGKTDLSRVKAEDLPEDLRDKPEPERRQEIEKRINERKKIREEILNLSKQRDEFIANERKKSGSQNGFDAAVVKALGEQLTRKGIE